MRVSLWKRHLPQRGCVLEENVGQYGSIPISIPIVRPKAEMGVIPFLIPCWTNSGFFTRVLSVKRVETCRLGHSVNPNGMRNKMT